MVRCMLVWYSDFVGPPWATRSSTIKALFRYTQKSKTLQDFLSHRILRHMHETINLYLSIKRKKQSAFFYSFLSHRDETGSTGTSPGLHWTHAAPRLCGVGRRTAPCGRGLSGLRSSWATCSAAMVSKQRPPSSCCIVWWWFFIVERSCVALHPTKTTTKQGNWIGNRTLLQANLIYNETRQWRWSSTWLRMNPFILLFLCE